MKRLFPFVVFVTITYASAIHPLSDEFIQSINNAKSTWKAGRNFAANTPLSQIRILMGVHPDNKKHTAKLAALDPGKDDFPESFDAREEWPDCKSISYIRDQGACGSCWALAAVEAMSDRLCIASNGTLQTLVSAEDLLDCCDFCCGFGCGGGWLVPAWERWSESGIVSGGLYNTTGDGCKAYSFVPCEHHVDGERKPCGESQETPKCQEKCDAGSSLDYKSDLTFGEEPEKFYTMNQTLLEIMTNGPVSATFDVYEDFLTYKSGVYQNLKGEYLGTHAIKILGWGVEDGTPYWLIANSWNNDWGDHGYFKMLRGENHLWIEDDVVAGQAKLK